MQKAVIISLFFAFLSPILWSMMDLIDEYIIDNKSRYPFGFAFFAGIINALFGLVLALFLTWDFSSVRDYWPSAISGFFLGIQFLVYFWMLKKDDVSNVIGFSYVYPVIVSILSFLFLHEVLTAYIYLGMGLIMFGIAMIYLRNLKNKWHVAFWVIIFYVLSLALYEFFIKVATTRISEINGLAVSSIFLGLTILPLIFFRKIRKEIVYESKNIHWAVLSEIFTISAVFTTYLAMKNLPATIVSSLQATQPLLVLAFERIANKRGIKKSQDTNFLNKLMAIILITAGVAIMYITEALR
jgi:drug/metabolite transporter (DMT)-like permease